MMKHTPGLNAVAWFAAQSFHQTPAAPIAPPPNTPATISVEQWNGMKWVTRDLVWNGEKYVEEQR